MPLHVEASFTLVLIRHGQTEANRLGLLQGQDDVPLNQAGIEQARRLAARLRAEAFDPGVLLASDLGRAMHTARIVAEALGHPGPRTAPEWRERKLGTFQGRTRDWLKEHDPNHYQAWKADPVGFEPPGGVSYRAHKAEVLQAMERLRREHPGGRVTVVTHGGCAYAALAICDRSDFPQDPKLRLDNTSISELGFTEARGWHSRRVNDRAHLVEASPNGDV